MSTRKLEISTTAASVAPSLARMSRMFSITARVCSRISSVVVPIASTFAPAIELSARRELVPETNRKSPARLMCGKRPRGRALSGTTVARLWLIVAPFGRGAIHRARLLAVKNRRAGRDKSRPYPSACRTYSWVDAHGRQCGIEIERMPAALAADARQPDAAERRTQIAQEPGVDPDHADAKASRQRMRTFEIARPQGCAKAVVGIVDPVHDFVFGIERRDVADRAEHFLAHAARAIVEPGPDRRLHVGAVVARVAETRHATAGDQGRAFGTGKREVVEHLVA